MSELATLTTTIARPLIWARGATGRITMYRLVLTSLSGLALVALFWSAVGALPYPPLALVATVCTALLLSYASNRAISAAFGVVPHSESSLITGLLLFFIFPPTTHLIPLLGVGLAAVLASCSKYVLAVRGRHIFNPAAAGAFLLTLTGFYYTGWWLGTPVMLPFSAVAAALILYRVHRITMALVFIGVSGGIMALRSGMAGLDPATALTWPFASSPMIFFAGLMLSEPLTQPPVRWQQLTFAGIIGFFFSTPMHLGDVYIAPESALLIGNALAFLVGQRQSIELVLQRKSQLTPTTFEFAFRPRNPLRFRPGQYLELTLPHKNPDNRGLRRVFSIASAPTDRDLVKIGTKVPEQPSTFKQALDGLAEGTVVTATSVAGDFLLPGDPRTPLLLVAGGIGITPFASQLGDLPRDHGRDIVLVYSVSDPTEIGYRATLEAAQIRVVVVSAKPVSMLPDRWEFVNARRLDRELLQLCVPDIASRDVLVSGPPNMVDGVSVSARALNARHVRTDYFGGY